MRKKIVNKMTRYQNMTSMISVVLSSIVFVLCHYYMGDFFIYNDTFKLLNPFFVLIVTYLTTLNGYVTSVVFCSFILIINTPYFGVLESWNTFPMMLSSLLTFLPIQKHWYNSKRKTALSVAINTTVFGLFWPHIYFHIEEIPFELFDFLSNAIFVFGGFLIHGIASHIFFTRMPRKIQRVFYCGRYYLAESDNFIQSIVHGKKLRLANRITMGLVVEAIILIFGSTLFANLLLFALNRQGLINMTQRFWAFNLRFIFLTASITFPILIILNSRSFKTIAQPIILMSKAMDDFTRNTIEQDVNSVVDINLLNIHTKDEIQELHNCLKETTHNITGYIEKVKHEQELEEDLKIAQEANKAKSVFLSNMSHEIRTPINAIMGFDEMIIRDTNNPDVLSYAKDIRSSSRALLSLINDILDFSKIEAGKMEIIPVQYDLSSLINDLVNMISIRAKDKGLEFNVNVDPNIPHLLYGDELRIRQCVLNILTNAVKYTKRGSVNMNVSFSLININQIMLRFQVVDTGVGIKQEDINKLFDAFERIDEKRNRTIEGTGLGMNIVKQMLELMSSHLEIKSEFGKGSDFAFGIQQVVLDHTPVGDFTKMLSDSMNSNTEFHDTFTAPNAKILFVDDTPLNLKVVTALLKRTQIQITTASSGEECLRLAKDNKYDLIFIDYRMPEMDGIETLNHLKKMTPNPNKNVPCIALTANAVSGAREMYLGAGFNDYLPKPIDVQKLDSLIKTYLPDELIGPPPEIKDEITANISAHNSMSNKSNYTAIEGINLGMALQYCGNKEILEQAFTEFHSRIEDRAHQIDIFLAVKDYRNYTVQVHSLKSTSRLIGAQELSSMAAYLEECADQEKYAELEAKTPELLRLYRSYKEKLAPVILVPEEKSLQPLTMTYYSEALQSIKEAISAFDFGTADLIVKELSNYEIPLEVKMQWELVKEQIKNVDQTSVLELLKDI